VKLKRRTKARTSRLSIARQEKFKPRTGRFQKTSYRSVRRTSLRTRKKGGTAILVKKPEVRRKAGCGYGLYGRKWGSIDAPMATSGENIALKERPGKRKDKEKGIKSMSIRAIREEKQCGYLLGQRTTINQTTGGNEGGMSNVGCIPKKRTKGGSARTQDFS